MKGNLFLFYLCSLYFLCPLFHLNAQPQCDVENYSIDEGLAQGVIMGIVQDQKGYMWFATWNGLNKFDGYTFETFKARPGDGCTLDDNRVEYIVTGKYDWIWCRTYDLKAYIFHPDTQIFTDVLESIPSKDAQVKRINALKKGVVWLICSNGSCFRFDETIYKQSPQFKQYSLSHKNLKSNVIYNIVQDSENDEWILTSKGATIVGKKRIHSQLPFRYLEEINNEIWLATKDGQVATYQKSTGTVTQLPLPVSSAQITVLKKVDDEWLAIGTSNHGLLMYNILHKSFKRIDLRTALQPSNDVQTLYVDKQKIIWISTQSDGVTHWNSQTQTVSYFPPLLSQHSDKKYDRFYFIFEDNNDYLWIHPKGGCFNFFDRSSNQLQYFHNNPLSVHPALKSSVHTYFSDRQGNLWLNTADRELDKFNFFRIPYTITNFNFETRAFLLDKDEQQLWIASKDQKVRIYDVDKKPIGFLTSDGRIVKQESTFNASVYCMAKMKDGTIWLGTKFDGLYILKKESGNTHRYQVQHYKHHPSEPSSISNNNIYSIYTDKKNRTWIGCFGGGLNLVEYTQDGKIKFINSNNRLKNYPQSTFHKIRCISENANGMLMVGTTKGLICFSSDFKLPEKIRFHPHVRLPNDSSSLSSNNISHLYTTRNKETYVSTLGGGINKITSPSPTPEQIKFKSYSQQSGLTFDWVLSSTEDTDGRLWVVSENTLSKFNPHTETFDNYSRSFLKHDSYYSEAVPVMDANGSLLVGTNKGFIQFPIDKIHKSQYSPNIVLTNIKILNDSQPIRMPGLSEISLESHQRNITIEFAALDYAAPNNIQYAYKLDGLEKGWNHSGKKRSASYINLPHGTYKLLIQSTNSDGVWTNNTYTLTIHVLPKFSETMWAWLLYFLLFLLFVIIIVYILFYIYRLRHQVNIEQQIADIKLHFFTDLSHELRTPLTLIAGPVTELLRHEELSEKVKEHLSLVQKNTDRMLKLVNQILDFRKIQNNKMKLVLEETDIISFLPSIMEHFQLMAKEKNISLLYFADSERLPLWIDTDKFEKIIFNLLSNAFKYTPDGKSITLQVSSDDSTAHISVIDEGAGISSNHLSTIFQRFETIVNQNITAPSSGIGLSLVKELVELHHGTIQVTSEPGKGSCFEVLFVKGKSHFAPAEPIEFLLSDSESSHHLSHKTKGNEIEETEINNEKLSMLIVEDNLELREFLKEILSLEYHVIEAGNGQEGLEKARQFVPGIILSDVMMPIMDGLDMVKEIKEDKNICHIPLILLSAKSSLDDRIKGLEKGIDEYITKPFSTTYLKVRIATLLKQRKLLQENYRQALLSLPKKENVRQEPTPEASAITPYDQQFIQQILDFMKENMSNSELAVEDISNALAMGRTVFYEKVKSIVGVSPIEFISEIRIKHAVQLLDAGEKNIAQVAFMTGFNDPKYFSRCFKKQMGVTPTQYKEGHSPMGGK